MVILILNIHWINPFYSDTVLSHLIFMYAPPQPRFGLWTRVCDLFRLYYLLLTFVSVIFHTLHSIISLEKM